jgi:DinB superfamily
MNRRLQVVAALPGYESDIGRWLWAMQETRRRTVGLVEDLDQAVLDWRGSGGTENSIGSLLYHIALIEMDWLFADIMGQDIPPSVLADFPLGYRDPAGRLVHVPAVSARDHIGRLNRTREVFLNAFQGMSLQDWNRVRSPAGADYDVSPAWVVFHLVEHEAGHAFQISSVRARARRALAAFGPDPV